MYLGRKASKLFFQNSYDTDFKTDKNKKEDSDQSDIYIMM